jgi:hypothetical protein
MYAQRGSTGIATVDEDVLALLKIAVLSIFDAVHPRSKADLEPNGW